MNPPCGHSPCKPEPEAARVIVLSEFVRLAGDEAEGPGGPLSPEEASWFDGGDAA